VILLGIMTLYPQNDYLEHHGIKGQKWGVRRYQNSNGTLTAEGRAKYQKYMDKYKGDKDFEYRVALRRNTTHESREMATIGVAKDIRNKKILRRTAMAICGKRAIDNISIGNMASIDFGVNATMAYLGAKAEIDAQKQYEYNNNYANRAKVDARIKRLNAQADRYRRLGK
jgi:hypothetical protein